MSQFKLTGQLSTGGKAMPEESVTAQDKAGEVATVNCSVCHGTGKVFRHPHGESLYAETMFCSPCGGSGRVVDEALKIKVLQALREYGNQRAREVLEALAKKQCPECRLDMPRSKCGKYHLEADDAGKYHECSLHSNCDSIEIHKELAELKV